jgi:hypothetical protein|tara:strand:+ start:359 stop:673 length:315 start_codon:yes stop_codon:yes gene_type:complete
MRFQIGTVRIDEAKAYDSHAGYHQFHDTAAKPYGSFEVFWHDGNHMAEQDDDDMPLDEWRDAERAGWYWAAGFPGCLYDGDPSGPFAYSRQAHQDADEWSPEHE